MNTDKDSQTDALRNLIQSIQSTADTKTFLEVITSVVGYRLCTSKGDGLGEVEETRCNALFETGLLKNSLLKLPIFVIVHRGRRLIGSHACVLVCPKTNFTFHATKQLSTKAPTWQPECFSRINPCSKF